MKHFSSFDVCREALGGNISRGEGGVKNVLLRLRGLKRFLKKDLIEIESQSLLRF
jgi:hypothetical protein